MTLELVRVLHRGTHIYREANGVGGHRYWSDSIGGGVVVWDTSLAGRDELLGAIAAERPEPSAIDVIATVLGERMPGLDATHLAVSVYLALAEHDLVVGGISRPPAPGEE